LFALIAARLIWLRKSCILTTRRWLAATIALNFVLGLIGFPITSINTRRELRAGRRDIVSLTRGQPLYNIDTTTQRMNVTFYINRCATAARAAIPPPGI